MALLAFNPQTLTYQDLTLLSPNGDWRFKYRTEVWCSSYVYVEVTNIELMNTKPGTSAGIGGTFGDQQLMECIAGSMGCLATRHSLRGQWVVTSAVTQSVACGVDG